MPPVRSDDARQRRLLNIMLSALGLAAVLMLLLGLVLLRATSIGQLHEWRSFLAATIGLLLAATAIWLVNRYGSRPLAALLFLLVLILIGLYTDEPGRFATGTGMLVFSIPIAAASVLLRPWGSFLTAGLTSTSIVTLSIVSQSQYPSIPSLFLFFILATVSWLAARSLELALENQRQTHRSLARSEVRYRTLVETLPDFVVLVDAQGNISFGNRRFAQLLGLPSRDTMLGQAFEDYIAPEGREAAMLLGEEVLKGRKVADTPVKMVRSDGTVLPIELSSLAVYDDDGDATGLVIVGRDISERRRLDDTLRYQATLLSNVLDAVISTDMEFFVRSWNSAAERIYGWTAHEAVGRPLYQLIQHDYVGETEEEVRRQFRTGGFWRGEASHTRKDGSQLTVLSSVSLIRDKEGIATGVVSVNRDISERIAAERELREQERRFRTLLDNVRLLAVGLDEHGRVAYVNPHVLELTGYSEEEALGADWFTTFLPPGRRPEVGTVFREMIASELHPHHENPIVTKDGEERLISWNNTLLLDTDGNPVGTISIGEDITDRRRSEQELQRSLHEAARGQRTLLALGQAAQTVQRSRTPDQVFQTIGDEVTRLGYHAIALLLDGSLAQLRIAHHTLQPTLLSAAEKLTGVKASTYKIPLAQSPVLTRLLHDGGAYFSESTVDMMSHGLPQEHRSLASRLCRVLGLEQIIAVPLLVGDSALGFLLVTGRGLSAGDVPAVTAFAHQAAIALENTRLDEAEREASQQLRDLAGYLQAAREKERSDIAREIHDEFGQMLSALNMDISWLSARLSHDRPELVDKLSGMSDLVDSGINSVRRVATELRPGLLDDLGLVAAIEWQMEEFAERSGLDCTLHLPAEDVVLDRDRATALFRIFQETLTNIARHAEATEVGAQLWVSPEEITLVVADNGKGITSSELSDPVSLGLLGIRERAHYLGGQVDITGRHDQGTTITVHLPWERVEEPAE